MEPAMDDRIATLERLLDREKAKVEERELSYNAAAQIFELQNARWEAEIQDHQKIVERLEAEAKKHKEDELKFRDSAEQLRARQARIDDLQRALTASAKEREDHVRLLLTKEEVVVAQQKQIVQLTQTRDKAQEQVAQLEAALRDVDTQRRIELLQTQYENTSKFHMSKIKYLEEELQAKTQQLLDDHKTSSTELLSLRQRGNDMEHQLGVATAAKEQLTDRVQQLEGFLTDARTQARVAEEKLVDTESHFQKQVAQYEGLLEELGRSKDEKAAELSNAWEQVGDLNSVLKETDSLRQQMSENYESLENATSAKINRLTQHLKELQAAASAARSAQDFSLLAEALTAGMLTPNSVSPPGYTGALPEPSTPELGAHTGAPPSRLIGGMTPEMGAAALVSGSVDMYSKYIDMADAWRGERAQVRKLEAYIEQISAEVAAKAEGLEQERAEMDAVEKAHRALQASVAGFKDERSHLEQRLFQADADRQRVGREHGVMCQTITDLTRQVECLVDEVQRLKGMSLPRGSAADPATDAMTAEQLLTSSGVISSRLVTFRNLQELMEQNRRLLSLSRTLSAENERSKDELRKEMGNEWGAREANLRSELEDHRQLVNELTEAGNRTAEYIRSLQLQQRNGSTPTPRTSASPQGGPHSHPGNLALAGPSGLGLASPGGQVTLPPFSLASEELSIVQEQLAQALKDLDTTKVEAGKNVGHTQAQVGELREKLANATSEASLFRQRFKDEQRRLHDVQAQLSSEQKQMQGMAMEKARSDGLLHSYQQQMHSLQKSVEDLQKELSSKVQRVLALEVDVGSSRTSMERLNNELSAVAAEKGRVTMEGMTYRSLKESAENSLRSYTGEAEAKRKALEEELTKLKSTFDVQQTLFHESLTAANEQVTSTKSEAAALRQSKEALDSKLAASRSEVSALQANIKELQLTISELGLQLSDARAAADGGDGVVEVGRYRELEGRVSDLNVEVTNTKEALDAKENQVKTYQESFKQVQEQYDTIRADLEAAKKDHEQAAAQASQAESGLSQRVEEIKAEVSRVEAERDIVRSELEDLQASSSSELQHLRGEVARLEQHRGEANARINELTQDIVKLNQQVRDYRSRYESHITDYAKDVAALRESEQQLDEEKNRVLALRSELISVQDSMSTITSRHNGELTEVSNQLAASEAKVAELNAANELMLRDVRQMLAGTTPELVGMSASSYKELMDYIGRDKTMAQTQLQLLSEERNRLKVERDSATKAAAELRAQMNSMQDVVVTGRSDLQTRIDQLTAEDHLRRAHIGQLRGELDVAKANLERANTRAASLAAEQENQQAALRTSEAACIGMHTSMEGYKNGELMWHDKYNSLLQKYGKVTLEEHQSLQQKLAESDKRLADLAPKLSSLEAKEKALAEAKAAIEGLKKELQGAKDKSVSEGVEAKKHLDEGKKQIFLLQSQSEKMRKELLEKLRLTNEKGLAATKEAQAKEAVATNVLQARDAQLKEKMVALARYEKDNSILRAKESVQRYNVAHKTAKESQAKAAELEKQVAALQAEVDAAKEAPAKLAEIQGSAKKSADEVVSQNVLIGKLRATTLNLRQQLKAAEDKATSASAADADLSAKLAAESDRAARLDVLAKSRAAESASYQAQIFQLKQQLSRAKITAVGVAPTAAPVAPSATTIPASVPPTSSSTPLSTARAAVPLPTTTAPPGLNVATPSSSNPTPNPTPPPSIVAKPPATAPAGTKRVRESETDMPTPLVIPQATPVAKTPVVGLPSPKAGASVKRAKSSGLATPTATATASKIGVPVLAADSSLPSPAPVAPGGPVPTPAASTTTTAAPTPAAALTRTPVPIPAAAPAPTPTPTPAALPTTTLTPTPAAPHAHASIPSPAAPLATTTASPAVTAGQPDAVSMDVDQPVSSSAPPYVVVAEPAPKASLPTHIPAPVVAEPAPKAILPTPTLAPVVAEPALKASLPTPAPTPTPVVAEPAPKASLPTPTPAPVVAEPAPKASLPTPTPTPAPDSAAPAVAEPPAADKESTPVAEDASLAVSHDAAATPGVGKVQAPAGPGPDAAAAQDASEIEEKGEEMVEEDNATMADGDNGGQGGGEDEAEHGGEEPHAEVAADEGGAVEDGGGEEEDMAADGATPTTDDVSTPEAAVGATPPTVDVSTPEAAVGATPPTVDVSTPEAAVGATPTAVDVSTPEAAVHMEATAPPAAEDVEVEVDEGHLEDGGDDDVIEVDQEEEEEEAEDHGGGGEGEAAQVEEEEEEGAGGEGDGTVDLDNAMVVDEEGEEEEEGKEGGSEAGGEEGLEDGMEDEEDVVEMEAELEGAEKPAGGEEEVEALEATGEEGALGTGAAGDGTSLPVAASADDFSTHEAAVGATPTTVDVSTPEAAVPMEAAPPPAATPVVPAEAAAPPAAAAEDVDLTLDDDDSEAETGESDGEEEGDEEGGDDDEDDDEDEDDEEDPMLASLKARAMGAVAARQPTPDLVSTPPALEGDMGAGEGADEVDDGTDFIAIDDDADEGTGQGEDALMGEEGDEGDGEEGEEGGGGKEDGELEEDANASCPVSPAAMGMQGSIRALLPLQAGAEGDSGGEDKAPPGGGRKRAKRHTPIAFSLPSKAKEPPTTSGGGLGGASAAPQPSQPSVSSGMSSRPGIHVPSLSPVKPPVMGGPVPGVAPHGVPGVPPGGVPGSEPGEVPTGPYRSALSGLGGRGAPGQTRGRRGGRRGGRS